MSGSVPTIPETHEAKRIFLKGFEAHYGIDPRVGLLGMKENGYEYVNEKYGNVLISTKVTWKTHVDDGLRFAGCLAVTHWVIDVIRSLI